jgi:CarD family transcriptional regulator
MIRLKGGIMMFEIGDKVVYPMHGAGIIEGIETKEILGKKQQYYILNFPMGGMKVMIPTKNVDEIGVREIIPSTDISKVVQVLSNPGGYLPDNWNKRYRANLDKIKTGDIFEVADVVRDLMIRDREKGLSSAEKKMLNNARQILISEMCMSTSYDEEEIATMIDKITLREKAKETASE